MRKAIGLVVLLLAGCATGYHSAGYTGGFSETQLGPNVWTVNFVGNGYTSGQRAVNFALLRAADLMLENGYRYFIVAESQSGSTSSYNTYGSATAYGNTAHGSSRTYTVTKPSTAMMVVGYKEKPDVSMSFDARFISESLRAKYGIE